MKFKNGELEWKDRDRDRILVSVMADGVLIRTYPPNTVPNEAGIVFMSRKKAVKFAKALLAEVGE